MTHEPIVFVVDDDERARGSVCALVRSMGLASEPFSSAEEFLSFYDNDKPGCLVTDVRMLGMSGLDLQSRLKDLGSSLPVVVLTAYATTPVTVHAMQTGAVTVLDKPYREDELWNAIRKALARDTKRRVELGPRQEIRRRLEQLTPGERSVLDLVVAGRANKVIARRLNISVRTVENRRHDIYEKLQAVSVVELVRMVIEAETDDDGC